MLLILRRRRVCLVILQSLLASASNDNGAPIQMPGGTRRSSSQILRDAETAGSITGR